MRIAETTRIGSLIALSLVAALSVFTVRAMLTPEAPVAIARRVIPTHTCGIRLRALVAPAPRDGYADTLMSSRDALTACMKDQHVDVRLSLEINADGRMISLDVKAMTVTNLDLHVVKCINGVVTPLQFPHGPGSTRVSTYLQAR